MRENKHTQYRAHICAWIHIHIGAWHHKDHAHVVLYMHRVLAYMHTHTHTHTQTHKHTCKHSPTEETASNEKHLFTYKIVEGKELRSRFLDGLGVICFKNLWVSMRVSRVLCA